MREKDLGGLVPGIGGVGGESINGCLLKRC